MGFFDSIGDIVDPGDFNGRGGAKAQEDASKLQFEGTQLGIAEQQRQFDRTKADLQPFVTGGQGLAHSLAAASTISGLPTPAPQLGGIGTQGGIGQDLEDGRPASAAEVTQLYRDILGREPDPRGLQFYLNEGYSPAGVAQAHRGSQEYIEKFQAGTLPEFELTGQQPNTAPTGPNSGGFGHRIDELSNSGVLDPLIRERLSGVQNQLSASGLRRSGAALEEAAAVPTEVLLAIEDNLFGRLQNTVGSSQNAAAGLGAIGSNKADSVSSLLTSGNNALAQGLVNSQNATDQGKSQLLQLGAAALFSDSRLKTNVKEIGSIGPLTLYEWDWIDEAPDVVTQYPRVGFMAHEVAELIPDAVGEFGGFNTVDYDRVLEEVA